jgi:hypothetical protein
MHTGINYYYFNDAINTLAANGFLRRSSSAFKSRKNKHTMAGAIDRVAISNFTSAYMGTVGCFRCYLWCYCSVCLYVPNAELALMFIPAN